MMDERRCRDDRSLPLIVEDEEQSLGSEKLNMTQEVHELLKHVDQFSFDDRFPIPSTTGTADKMMDDEHNDERHTSMQEKESSRPLRTTRNNTGEVFVDDENTAEITSKALQLLREAKAERAAARSWSNEIRQAVLEWVIQQQRLIRQPVRQLHDQLSRERIERQQAEADLHAVLQHQQARIETLEATVASQKISIESLSNSERKSRIQIKPTVQQSSRELITPKHAKTLGGRPLPPPTVSPPSPPKTKRHSASQLKRRHLSTSNGGNSNKASLIVQDIDDDNDVDSNDNAPEKCLTRHTYPNGAVRERFSDREIIRFPNGDHQTTTKEGVVAYYFAATGVTQTEMKDVLRISFRDGQVEEHWRDGRVIVQFPDGTEQSFEASSSSCGTSSPASCAVTV